MVSEIDKKVHWSFWAIATVGLIWNVMGGINFLMQLSPLNVANMPETHRVIVVGRPIWITAGFAFAVFGGAIGCLLLLLKRRSSIPILAVSLAGTVLATIHALVVVGSLSAFSPVEILLMIFMPVAVATFLLWYSLRAGRRGRLH